jgi:hypothetical protein
MNGDPTQAEYDCHLWRPGMLKIDLDYEKGLQIAVALADRDHIFYHSLPFLA